MMAPQMLGCSKLKDLERIECMERWRIPDCQTSNAVRERKEPLLIATRAPVQGYQGAIADFICLDLYPLWQVSLVQFTN